MTPVNANLSSTGPRLPKPPWLRRPLPAGATSSWQQHILRLTALYGVATVCQAARCPNQGECWCRGELTFLLLGPVCTRGCPFCQINSGRPQPVDEDAPWRLAALVRLLGLRRVIITSVTRDDLPDGGAGHFAEVIRVLRRGSKELPLEILSPDFQGHREAWETVAAASPDIWGHNLETVPRLYPILRPGSSYDRSLTLLAWISHNCPASQSKSGLMLGLGETEAEVAAVLQDLRDAGVHEVTLGQYLAPSRRHYPVARYLSPAEFAAWETYARDLGFPSVRSGPWVRSSYYPAARE